MDAAICPKRAKFDYFSTSRYLYRPAAVLRRSVIHYINECNES